ncbi:MAG: ABC transporter ATP-binding protein/permease [Bacilli bacterium]|nr:ABC transporter ATP-binding protein/permease [Bacilli bacterium]
MDDEKERLSGDRKMSLGEILRHSRPYVAKEKWAIIFSLLLIALYVGAGIALPMLTSQLVRVLQEETNSQTLSMVVGIVAGYAALGLAEQGVLYLQSMTLQKAGQRIVYGLRMEVFEHIENMSLNQFNQMATGSLVTRACNYTAAVSDLFTSVLVHLISNLLTVFGVLGIMMFISIRLSLYLLIFALVAGVTSFFFGKIVRRIFHKERQYISDLNAFLSENLSGMRITQIFNQERRKSSEFDEKNQNIRRANYQVVLAFALYRPFLNLLYYGSIAVTFWVGLSIALSGAEIVAFYLYLSRFFNPIQNIADQLNQISRAVTAAQRLYSLLEVQPEVVDPPDAIEIDHFEGKIEFKNVWFAYEGEHWILKDVSFVVEPKTTTAFVGATGAGKTTILSLIVRNYAIQKGQILIDDIDIATIKIDSLRKAVGQMLQDVFLFSGSIRTNLTLHDDEFTDEEIRAATDYVNATPFIERLPNKLEEEVLERGENFSAGQRQLLSFARTILHRPQILILDEATANIDTETELLIQDSLEKIKTIGTMLVVAHRLSTIQHADNIIVLQSGEVLEQGSHQALLKKRGYYYKLYQLQYAEQEG